MPLFLYHHIKTIEGISAMSQMLGGKECGDFFFDQTFIKKLLKSIDYLESMLYICS